MLPEIKAWRLFAKKVEARLIEKNEEGYTGWDKEEELPSRYLKQQLTDDAIMLERDDCDDDTYIDVAARAMMLHHRSVV